jgi:NTP pyrophosphatase (non-canonical NTP hydrolase)
MKIVIRSNVRCNFNQLELVLVSRFYLFNDLLPAWVFKLRNYSLRVLLLVFASPSALKRFDYLAMSDFQELLDLLVRFRDERDWAQFHDSKNLALALSIEAAELNELFLWKKDDQAEQVDQDKLREELADVFAYAIMLAGRHGLDVSEIVKDKIAKNAKKYPVEKSKGNSAKYDDLS